MVLESYKHPVSSFITLTYNEAHYPKGGTLVPRDLKLFLMRLRSRLSPRRIRFYACGEYGGGEQERPHYHAALFGVGQDDVESIEKAWHSPDTKQPIGFVHVGTLTLDSAQYITKYIQKGYNKRDDDRLKGRHPEFARMSNRPGIGALVIKDVAESLNSDAGMELLLRNGDVPAALSHGKRSLPLGRYLRSKLRQEMGLDEEKIRKENYQRKTGELSALREKAKGIACPKARAEAEHQWEAKKQKIRNLEAKIKIHRKGGVL